MGEEEKKQFLERCFAKPSLYTFFLRTALSRPSLGGCVQSLDVAWFSTEQYLLDGLLNEQTATDVRIFAAAARRFDIQESLRSKDTQMLLLLHGLPNLRELDMSLVPAIPLT